MRPNIVARGAEVKVEIATDEGVAYAARFTGRWVIL